MDSQQPDAKTAAICNSLLDLIPPLQQASENIRAGKDIQKAFTLGFYTHQTYLLLREASQSVFVRHAVEQVETALNELQEVLAVHGLNLEERPPWRSDDIYSEYS